MLVSSLLLFKYIKISEVSFEEGDSVKEGTKLITFDMENLEKDNQKAAMSFQSGKYDYEDTIKKSDKAESAPEPAHNDEPDGDSPF